MKRRPSQTAAPRRVFRAFEGNQPPPTLVIRPIRAPTTTLFGEGLHQYDQQNLELADDPGNRRPDVYRIKNRVTVLDAIAMAGGFTDLARPNKVVVIRNTPAGPQRVKINVKQLVGDDGGAPFYLQTLDTVYVE